MCTASWLIADGSLHLFFNRDERRTRGPALEPAEHSSEGVRYLAPTDSSKLGTWIAVSERGAVLALMNRSEGVRPEVPGTRGRLIPKLIGARRSEGLAKWLSDEDLSDLPPFALLSFGYRDGDDRRSDARFVWDGRELVRRPFDEEVGVIASSGLGDVAVDSWRREAFLWARSQEPRWTVADHRAFHRSHVPERGPLSPCMHHKLASTVSLTEVDVTPSGVEMRYFAGSPCKAGAGPSSKSAIPR